MTLGTALILAGNLPAEEARKNTATRDRIAEVLHALDLALAEWEEIDDD